MAHGLLVASNAAEALRCNIAEEQHLYSQFVNAVRSIVQPIQTAIAMVQVASQHATVLRWRLITAQESTTDVICCMCWPPQINASRP